MKQLSHSFFLSFKPYKTHILTQYSNVHSCKIEINGYMQRLLEANGSSEEARVGTSVDRTTISLPQAM